jgi:putative MATE family efflux protein
MTTDLTHGNVTRVILSFSLPLLLSTVLQQCYNIADSMIVGQFTGADGLAAIGAAYPVTLFFVAIATGASMGCSVVVSQLFGARNMDHLHKAVFTALISLSVLGLALSLLGIALSGPLMHLLNASDSVFPNARLYLAIYAAGVLPMLIYNAANGVFTGLGDSKLPLYLLLISSVLNVILDLVAVRVLSWGVAGAAIATSFSQLVAAVLAVSILVYRIRRIVGTHGGYFDRAILLDISRAAVPCILQQSCVALTHTIVQSILNTYDTAIIAGYEAASKLHNFAYMGLNTIGTAFASFTAQCRGAKKYSRIWQGFRTTILVCLGITACIILLFQLLPGALIGLFIDADSAPMVITAGTNYLRIISPVYSIICFIIATGGLLRGMDRSFAFFVETLLEFTVRVTMCFVLTRVLQSYTGLLWAWYFGSSCGFLMCLGLSIQTYRKSKALQ